MITIKANIDSFQSDSEELKILGRYLWICKI